MNFITVMTTSIIITLIIVLRYCGFLLDMTANITTANNNNVLIMKLTKLDNIITSFKYMMILVYSQLMS